MRREKKLVKNTLVLSLGTFLPKFASFVTLPILTAYLTKEEYGTYDLISVLVSLFLPAITLQIETAAFRFLIDVRDDYDRKKDVITNVFAFVIPTSLLSILIAWVFIPVNDSQIKLLICLYFLIDIIISTTRQIARGLGYTKHYSISAIVSTFGQMLLIVIFLKELNYGLSGALLAIVVSATTSWLILSVNIKLFQYLSVSRINIELLKSMISYSWPMVPNSMSMWVMRLSDRMVVTAFMGISWNAIYAVSNKIPSLLQLAQKPFTYAWQENASLATDDADVGIYYSSVFKNLLNLTAGLFGLLIASAPFLFRIFIRGDYADAYYQIPILFLSEFFYTLATFFGGIYVAYKKTKNVGITTILAALMNLIIDFSLIKYIGLYAASLSTLLSYLALFVFRCIDIQKILKINVDLKHIISVVAILTVESVFCYFNNIYYICLNIIISIAVFFVLNKKTLRQICFAVVNKMKNGGGQLK